MESIIVIFLFLICLSPLVLSAAFKGKKAKKAALFANIVAVCLLVISTMAVSISAADVAPAAEQTEEAAPAAEQGMSVGSGLGLLGAALVTGLSCVGAGIAVSSSASAAIGAISENPATFGKALIFVALAEGVALYGLLISIQILGKF